MVGCRAVRTAGMVILARHLLLSHGVDMLRPPMLPTSAEEPGREPSGGGQREQRGGGQQEIKRSGGINADDLVKSSRFAGKTAENQNSGSTSGILHFQKRRSEFTAEGYGSQSAAQRVKEVDRKSHFELNKELGACLGRGLRAGDKLKGTKALRKKKCVLRKLTQPLQLRENKMNLVDERKDKTGMKRAFEIALSKPTLISAMDDLKGNFSAASSKASRDVKRKEIIKLASMVAGGENRVFPLEQEVVEGTAACLKAANMKSGDQYMNELKLVHVESGYDLPPWLTRTFTLCKKALARHKGPTKKAPEARIENIKEDVWVTPGGQFEGGVNPGLAYAWACLWMLREIEANACKWEHVRVDGQARRISLFIPVSKMDQMGRGVKRTLQCCGQMPCIRFCAWSVWQRMETERAKRKTRGKFMFVDKDDKQLSKSKMIELWKTANDGPLSGHSARRSGAMEHVRQGLQIQELAFLGRWRSAVVLTYANDALQEMPANRVAIGMGETLNNSQNKSPWTPMTVPAIPAPVTPARLEDAETHPLAEVPAQKDIEITRPGEQSLWVSSVDKRKGKKVWHRVTKAGWQIPMADWGTACGWNFTKNPDRISISASLTFNQTRCLKCSEVMKARDRVKEGENLASIMQRDAIKQF
eukprot:s3697_g5.t1